jgi:predicted ATP-dependent endonuclease of OLD family
MDKIILENFRCFRTYREVPLAPLTLLVGENSTGKTAFLAAIRLAWDLAFQGGTYFNEDPFSLGAFDQIASYSGGKGGRARQFTIGCSIWPHTPSREIKVIAHFRKDAEQPELCEKLITAGGYNIGISEIHGPRDEDSTNISIKTPTGTYEIDEYQSPDFATIRTIWRLLNQYENSADSNANEALSKEALKQINRILERALPFRASGKRPFAASPTRTSPRRSYDPKKQELRSSGDNIPMLLATIKFQGEKNEWMELRKALTKFGESSGLFKDIRVKKFGKSLVDPFQIQIKVGSVFDNIIDVGYGVSQVLPLLVESIKSSPRQILLLQQPEVHLHPRAQAELGSLLGNIANIKKNKFVVETHSDNIIDRIRLDLRDKKPGFLKPEDVLILYFERDKNEVKIYPIRLDKMGNVLGAPPSYRSFFLEEDRRFWD